MLIFLSFYSNNRLFSLVAGLFLTMFLSLTQAILGRPSHIYVHGNQDGTLLTTRKDHFFLILIVTKALSYLVSNFVLFALFLPTPIYQ